MTACRWIVIAERYTHLRRWLCRKTDTKRRRSDSFVARWRERHVRYDPNPNLTTKNHIRSWSMFSLSPNRTLHNTKRPARRNNRTRNPVLEGRVGAGPRAKPKRHAIRFSQERVVMRAMPDPSSSDGAFVMTISRIQSRNASTAIRRADQWAPAVCLKTKISSRIICLLVADIMGTYIEDSLATGDEFEKQILITRAKLDSREREYDDFIFVGVENNKDGN